MKLVQLFLEYYHERKDSTVTHDSQKYSLNILFKLTQNSPIKKYSVDSLKWILKYKESNRSNIDTTKPILVTKWKNKLVVLDGWHRLKKAVKLNMKNLPGRLVTPEMLEKAKCQ